MNRREIVFFYFIFISLIVFSIVNIIIVEGKGTSSVEIRENETNFSIKNILVGWEYKISIDIIPPPSIANYQLKIELNTTNFDYSKTDSAGDDIRFIDSLGNSLSYYIEKWNPIGTSIVWVKIAKASTPFIEMYFGNPLASSESNGEETFIFFEDFSNPGLNLTKWLVDSDIYSSYEITDDYLRLNTDTGNDFTGFAFVGFSDMYFGHGQPLSTSVDNMVGIGIPSTTRGATTVKDDWEVTEYHVPQMTWFTNEIRWFNNSYVEFDNGTNIAVHTAQIPTVPLQVTLATRAAYAGPGDEYGILLKSYAYPGTSGCALKSFSWHHNSLPGYPQPGGELRVDWFFVRKLLDSEPLAILGPIELSDESLPLITSSGDLEYIVGRTNNYISWILEDDNPGTYNILREGIMLVSDTPWTDGLNVTINVDLLSLGIYNYTLVAKDTFDNEATSTIFVTVRELDPPPLITTSNNNLEYQFGTTGNFISWILEDDNPDTYEIYRDGILFTLTASWTDGQNISINVDLLPVGTYNYTLVAKDTSDNEASNTIWVAVVEPVESSYFWISSLILVVLPFISKRRKK